MILAAVFHDDPGKRTHVEVFDTPVKIGRNAEIDPGENAVPFRISWPDRVINRNHSVARRDGDCLVIERLPPLPKTGRSAPNPLYSNAPSDSRVKLHEPVRLQPGDSFVIGAAGRTSFFWLRSLDDFTHLTHLIEHGRAAPEPDPRDFERSTDAAADYDQVADLDEYSMRLQLQLLQRELPEKVLSGWTNEEDLFTRASDFLQSALPGQKAVSVAFIALNKNDPETPCEVLHSVASSPADFRPSRTLVRQLLAPGADSHRAHVWSSEEEHATFDHHSFVGQVDWVVALPLASLDKDAAVYRDAAGRPVYIYVETRRASNASARAFVPFLRLIASLVSSLLTARQKQRIQDQMSAYFSPAVRRHLQTGDEEALALTVADCTVLFCDRRASSRFLEKAKSDEDLLHTLRDNQDFVSRVTRIVFDHDGVITDFAGDGVLALWGWPRSSKGAPPDHALQAVDAAEAIAAGLAGRVELDHGQNTVAAFRVGISSGRIAVGKTGPQEQMHISVFGRVVNFGARLESLGKQFHVPVLLSEETAQLISGRGKLTRKLCYLKPAGFDQAYPIYELILPRELGGSGATPEHIADYEKALAAFVTRDWDRCNAFLQNLPDDDAPASWLAQQSWDFASTTPPPDWAGEVVSQTK